MYNTSRSVAVVEGGFGKVPPDRGGHGQEHGGAEAEVGWDGPPVVHEQEVSSS